MKFINYLESITGVDVYAITAFMIFFVVFIVASWIIIRTDKKVIDEISNIPLDN
jgi:hypothetical protein